MTPRDIVRSGLCIGCGGCGARMALGRDGHFRPSGGAVPEAFERLCPFSPGAADEDALAAARFPEAPFRHPGVGRFAAAYVGHAVEGDFRARGSSGGLATWVLAELLRRGSIDGVAHVAPAEDLLFRYRISRTEAEIRSGAKSRYYPVEMSGILAEIRAVPGRYAVVGIPCFVKAVHLLRREDPALRERVVVTAGLFCGHMKSARFVDSFARQMGVRPGEVRGIDYRLKDPRRPARWYTAQLTLRDGRQTRRDWWPLVDGDWGAGWFQAEACDYCDDVVAETADISFGDAWLEPWASDGRGTNVAVVRSPALAALLEEGRRDGRLALEAVDGDFVARTQEAGLRHRREGLAYRLTWPKRGLRPRKRVRPSARLPVRRRLIYRLRRMISAGSRRASRWPRLYLVWAKAMRTVYRAATYSEGRAGRMLDRFLGPPR